MENCLKVQKNYDYWRMTDVNAVLISFKYKQGWIINSLQYVLGYFYVFYVFTNSITAAILCKFAILTFS